jgi:hypothetical protein
MSHASVFLVAAGGSPHEAGTDQGAGQQAKGTGTYPVDAWLEGREHIENGDDVLMPIQKVESLMNCIALKEIVAQGPENPAATDGNSMHADFGDTTTTTNTHLNNTYTTNNTHTGPALNGDTFLSTPGIAGDTYMSTPPRTPRGGNSQSNSQSNYTTAVGRPPIVVSGQLQPASVNSTGNYGYSTAGVNAFHSLSTTVGQESKPESGQGSNAGPQLKGDVVVDMIGTRASDAAAKVPKTARVPQAAAAHVDLSPPVEVVDLSARPSVGVDGGSTRKVSTPCNRFFVGCPRCM